MANDENPSGVVDRDPDRSISFGRQLVALLPAFFVSTVAGGLIAAAFQFAADQRERASEERAATREAATALFDDVSRMMDERLDLARRRVIRREEYFPRSARGAAYEQAVEQALDRLDRDWMADDSAWTANLNRHRALICRYFGVEHAQIFEDSVHQNIQQIQSNLTADVLEPPGARDTVRPTAWQPFWRARDAIYRLDNHLVEIIRSGQFPTDKKDRCDRLDLRSPEARERGYREQQDTTTP